MLSMIELSIALFSAFAAVDIPITLQPFNANLIVDVLLSTPFHLFAQVFGLFLQLEQLTHDIVECVPRNGNHIWRCRCRWRCGSLHFTQVQNRVRC